MCKKGKKKKMGGQHICMGQFWEQSVGAVSASEVSKKKGKFPALPTCSAPSCASWTFL